MSFGKIINSFSTGFINGMFTNSFCNYNMCNPFTFNPFSFNPFNNIFNAYPSCMYTVPNIMSNYAFTPFMQPMMMPPSLFSPMTNIEPLTMPQLETPQIGMPQNITQTNTPQIALSQFNIHAMLPNPFKNNKSDDVLYDGDHNFEFQPTGLDTFEREKTSTNKTKSTIAKQSIKAEREEYIEPTPKASALKTKWNKINPNLPVEFYQKIIDISKDIHCNPSDLLALMNSESTLRSNQTNSIGAVGLIQFTRTTAKALGTTTQALKNMTPTKQLDYVKKYFLQNKKAAGYSKNDHLNAETLYALCFLPAFAKHEVLCQKGDQYYDSNKGLDIDKNNKITKSDLRARISKKMIA